jgi:hypothetical protein
MPELKDATPIAVSSETWPDLPFEAWKDTCATLHMWTQIVGKIRLAQAPHVNHWWQVALYVTSRGLTTSPMPYATRSFAIDFDFIDHRLRIETSEGERDSFVLVPCTVADFHQEIFTRLRALGLDIRIWTTPCEIPDPIPFEQDRTHKSYDRDAAHRFWRVLLNTQRVFEQFRSRFTGKVSPVNFYWGSFDLAITRFSGRRAPPHPGAPNIADSVTREAYSHEVSSLGFWPGNGGFGRPAFYSYAYPQPARFAQEPIAPAAAYYDRDLREFVLPYDAIRQSATPDEDLLAFAQSTYEAAAERAGWDRAALERDER